MRVGEASSGGEPSERVGEEALLQDGVQGWDTVVEELARTQLGGEGGGSDLAVVVAGVGADDFDGGAAGVAIDEEPVGLAAGSLIVDAHGLIDG